ncbi:unnamed protein product [Heterobilharzia americana]|nr:unnamed protein product [Heterobilharzia americana]
MSLVVGITSGFWIWSGKTVDSWQLCLKRTFNRSYATSTKRNQAASVGVLSHTGALLPNLSPPPNTGTIGWNAGQSKIWMNSSSNPKLAGGQNVCVNNCTTWQDDYIPNNRLLPQPPPVSLTCNHSAVTHMSHTMQIPGGSVIGTAGASLSGLQGNSGSFNSCPLEGTALSSGSGTNLPTQQNPGRKIDANSMFILSSAPMTHI